MVSNAGGSARTRLPCPNATLAGGVQLPNINGGSLAEYERSSQMKLWMKVSTVTLLVAVPAFLLGPSWDLSSSRQPTWVPSPARRRSPSSCSSARPTPSFWASEPPS